jgi:hypothetical protein
VRVLVSACLAIAVDLALGSRVARADGSGVIAASASDRAAVSAAMSQAMTGRANRIVPDAIAEARGAVAAGAVPVETLARFRRVREQVDEGWRAYLRVAVEVAAQRLASARTEAEVLVAMPGGPEIYADAALRLGAVLGHLGRTAESRAVLQLALALDPERPITLAEFSPDVVALVDQARAAPVSMQKLRVTTSPPGAIIAVDGKDAGRSPLELDVARGQHVVVARAPGHRAAVQGVAVDTAAAVEIALDRDEPATRLAGGATLGLGERAQQELVDAAMRYADLDEIVLVAETSRRGGPTLLVQRCAGLPARCSAVVDLGFSDASGLAAAARAAWQAARAGELRYPPSVLGERGGVIANGGGCRLCRNPWVWGGVGAALVVGTILTIVAVSGSSEPPIVAIDPDDYQR